MTPRKSANLHDSGDTIAAVITPPGQGGIAALRLAGPEAKSLLKKHFTSSQKTPEKPFLLRLGVFAGPHGPIDQVTAVTMPADRSYTGLEQVEIFCHGGSEVARAILQTLLDSGARAAEPGEFTKLAFLNGRMDLSQAEAVAEIIAAGTEQSLEAGREHLLGDYSAHIGQLREDLILVLAEIEAVLDFSEEEIDPAATNTLLGNLSEISDSLKQLDDSYQGGKIIRDGYRVAVAGRTNAGKSSLFNRLLKSERALVASQPGTTRDYLSEWLDLGGFAVELIDTAGMRSRVGSIEKEGQRRASDLMKRADLVLWVADLSHRQFEKNLAEDLKTCPSKKTLVVANKSDIVTPSRISKLDSIHVPISCKTGKGIRDLVSQITERIQSRISDPGSGLVVTSARHRQKIKAALKSIRQASRQLSTKPVGFETAAFELRTAADQLGEITGKIYTEQLLEKIFSQFCIGK